MQRKNATFGRRVRKNKKARLRERGSVLESETVWASANRAQEDKARFVCSFSPKMRGGWQEAEKSRKYREKLDPPITFFATLCLV